MTQISIKEIVFDGSIYPREKPSSKTIDEYADALASGVKFPPIILEIETKRLLDGYHRWKAHQKLVDYPELLDGEAGDLDFGMIDIEFHAIPEGVTHRLYAYSLSAKHGLRPKPTDAKETAIGQYKQMPGTPMTTFCKYLGVSDKTAKSFVSHLLAAFEETKNAAIQRLNWLGWTQQEIADKLGTIYPNAVGISQQSVLRTLSKTGESEKLRIWINDELEKGHDVETIAKRHGLPTILAWTAALMGENDKERLAKLGIKTQPYDVWNFSSCHDLMGGKHPGRIPGELVCHALYFFTNQGDLVIDPMVGSGTVLDACLLMGRKARGYDIDLHHDRIDIEQYDIFTGWPGSVKKADLIFWDPPYFSKKDDGYVEGSISGLPPDQYLNFLSERFKELKAAVKPGTRLAFLMSDWDSENAKEYEDHPGLWIWDYADKLRDAGWKLIRHIQCPLPTQQVHPDTVNKFRESKRLARLERYLLIGVA